MFQYDMSRAMGSFETQHVAICDTHAKATRTWYKATFMALKTILRAR